MQRSHACPPWLPDAGVAPSDAYSTSCARQTSDRLPGHRLQEQRSFVKVKSEVEVVFGKSSDVRSNVKLKDALYMFEEEFSIKHDEVREFQKHQTSYQ